MPWFSGRATFYLTEMTVESLIFVEQLLRCATKNVPGKQRVFICPRNWQDQMPTRVFILQTSISAMDWHFITIILLIIFITGKVWCLISFSLSFFLAFFFLSFQKLKSSYPKSVFVFLTEFVRFLYFCNLLVCSDVTSFIILRWHIWWSEHQLPQEIHQQRQGLHFQLSLKSSLPEALAL